MTTKFFWYCFVSLVRFSYWSKFHVNIITGSGVMTIFFCRRLTRNLAIGNTPIWVLPNIWRLRWVRNTKFDTNVSNEMLLNAAKCQSYSFYRFWVIERKPRGGVNYPPPPPPRLGSGCKNIFLQRSGKILYILPVHLTCIFLNVY